VQANESGGDNEGLNWAQIEQIAERREESRNWDEDKDEEDEDGGWYSGLEEARRLLSKAMRMTGPSVLPALALHWCIEAEVIVRSVVAGLERGNLAIGVDQYIYIEQVMHGLDGRWLAVHLRTHMLGELGGNSVEHDGVVLTPLVVVGVSVLLLMMLVLLLTDPSTSAAASIGVEQAVTNSRSDAVAQRRLDLLAEIAAAEAEARHGVPGDG
jgi:hypothetical protein